MPPPTRTPRNASKKVENTEEAPWFSWKETNRANRAIKFIETFCTLPKGYGAGKKMRLANFQKEWLSRVLVSDCNSAVMSLPRGNGKSTFLAALAVWALFDSDPEVGTPQIPIVATTMGQAIRSVYSVAIAMVEKEKELSSRSIRYSAIGAQKLLVPYNGGEMFPVSSDVDGLQGLDPSLAVCDEIGFQSQDSWDSLLLASGKRPNSLVVGIGTPGLDRENALFRLRKTVYEGGEIPGFIFTEYAADHGLPVADQEQWYKANPALAEGYMNINALHTALRASPESSFRIFRLGQWVDGVENWLGADGRAVWDALVDKYAFVDHAPTWIGVDVGIKRDSTAVACVQYRPDGRLHCKVKLWVPTKDEPVDVTDVMQHVREMCDRYKVGAVSFDPRFFDVPATMLHDEGIPMVEIPQSVERMTGIIGSAYEIIGRKEISHDGDESFTTQVLNAVPRFNERGFTLQKSKSRGRIDAAIAMSLAVDRATHKTKPRPKIVVL